MCCFPSFVTENAGKIHLYASKTAKYFSSCQVLQAKVTGTWVPGSLLLGSRYRAHLYRKKWNMQLATAATATKMNKNFKSGYEKWKLPHISSRESNSIYACLTIYVNLKIKFIRLRDSADINFRRWPLSANIILESKISKFA